MVAGILRCVLILKVHQQHSHHQLMYISTKTILVQNLMTGPQEGASWAVRESFVAVATSSLTMTWGWM